MHGRSLYNALIRTHHITSRKKIGKLRAAANANGVLVLIRTGGSPGIMYVEGDKTGVEAWISTVQKLRYKDYQLVGRPELVHREDTVHNELYTPSIGLSELNTVKEFALAMQHRGIFAWWRNAMGFSAGKPEQ